jgi:hypothetical protein
MYRGTVALPLTGGYDSRAMMAVSLDRKDELRYFTIIDATSPAHDVWLPFRIARRLSLGFEFVWARKAAPEMMDVIKRNTGRIWRDPNEHRIPAFAKPGAKYVVLGFASEILRCRDYKDGVHPVSVEPNLLASISGWRDDPVCIGATETWLATVPTGMNVATLDLYFWECRLGGWTALGCTALDTVVESISLFNCRQLFEVGLGLDVEYRSQPYKIYRELCRRHAPAVADMSFNTTPLDDIAELARRILPPAVRKHVKARVLAVRKRVAGASDLRA